MPSPFDTPERRAFRDSLRSFVAREITRSAMTGTSQVPSRGSSTRRPGPWVSGDLELTKTTAGSGLTIVSCAQPSARNWPAAAPVGSQRRSTGA